MLIKTRLDGTGGKGRGESECQRGQQIVPSERRGHQSVNDSSEESRRRPLTSGISPPLTSHLDITHPSPYPCPPSKQEEWLMSHTERDTQSLAGQRRGDNAAASCKTGKLGFNYSIRREERITYTRFDVSVTPPTPTHHHGADSKRSHHSL